MIGLFRRPKPLVAQYQRCTKCSTPVPLDPNGWDRLCDACWTQEATAPLRRTAFGWFCGSCPNTHYHGHRRVS